MTRHMTPPSRVTPWVSPQVPPGVSHGFSLAPRCPTDTTRGTPQGTPWGTPWRNPWGGTSGESMRGSPGGSLGGPGWIPWGPQDAYMHAPTLYPDGCISDPRVTSIYSEASSRAQPPKALIQHRIAHHLPTRPLASLHKSHNTGGENARYSF